MDGVCKVSLDAIRQLNCPFFSPQVHSLMLCKMQKRPCLQIQGCQVPEAVAGVILYSRNGL